MSTFKKTIFLSNKENTHKGMATLTLEKKQNGVFCTLKAYNLENNFDLVLGIKSSEKIVKQNVKLINGIYNFLLTQEISLENNLGCVLLSCHEQNITPILWGSEKSENYKTQIVNNLKDNVSKLTKTSYPKSSAVPPKVDLEIPSIHETHAGNIDDPEPITKVEEPTTNYQDCVCPPYKSTNNHPAPERYSQISLSEEHLNSKVETAHVANMASLFESSENEINESIDNELKSNESTNSNKHMFYDMIAEQLEDLFEKYPREVNLENLVENSRWVKINYEDNDKFYVVGIIYLNNEIKYICYGVPGSYYTEPPLELKDYSQWLPTDTLHPYENGYWVMYQDSDTGENVILK